MTPVQVDSSKLAHYHTFPRVLNGSDAASNALKMPRTSQNRQCQLRNLVKQITRAEFVCKLFHSFPVKMVESLSELLCLLRNGDSCMSLVVLRVHPFLLRLVCILEILPRASPDAAKA